MGVITERGLLIGHFVPPEHDKPPTLALGGLERSPTNHEDLPQRDVPHKTDSWAPRRHNEKWWPPRDDAIRQSNSSQPLNINR